jgi:hypothetical protein
MSFSLQDKTTTVMMTRTEAPVYIVRCWARMQDYMFALSVNDYSKPNNGGLYPGFGYATVHARLPFINQYRTE